MTIIYLPDDLWVLIYIGACVQSNAHEIFQSVFIAIDRRQSTTIIIQNVAKLNSIYFEIVSD